MAVVITVLTVLAWILVVIPPILFTIKWLAQRDEGFVPIAVWFASLMLVSFFILPWLDLQPLKHFNLAWVFGTVPWLELVGKWVGMDWLLTILEKLSGLEILFEPPGWLTLILAARPWLWLVTIPCGFVTVGASWLVSWPVQHKLPGYLLSVTSFILLVILFLGLPEIDGLGERAFPNMMALIVPILGAHIIVPGPLAMLIALLGLVLTGATHVEMFKNRSLVRDEEEIEW